MIEEKKKNRNKLSTEVRAVSCTGNGAVPEPCIFWPRASDHIVTRLT